MMCFLSPEGFPTARTDDAPPEGEATQELVGAGAPGRLGEGSMAPPLVPVVPPAVEEDMPATLLALSLVEATAATDTTEATATLAPDAPHVPTSSFLEP